MRGDSDDHMLNTIFLGEVASVQNYGAFIRIPGGKNQGLVHRSQISSVNVPDASEVLARDDKVWCKVISINPDGKIALSMKVVDQGSGKDLDPNGVQIRHDEQKRKEWVPGGQRKVISLDAVYNTTCSKCGTRGHLGKDCFQTAGGKRYELLAEEDPEPSPTVQEDPEPSPTVQNTGVKSDEKKRKKKEKKEAKKIKKAKKKLKKALKKQLKREKKLQKRQSKKKKRKESSSEDSSDSSSDSSDSEDDKKIGAGGNQPSRREQRHQSLSRSPSPNKNKRRNPSPSEPSHMVKVRRVSRSRSPSSRRKSQSRSCERKPTRSCSPHRLQEPKFKKRPK